MNKSAYLPKGEHIFLKEQRRTLGKFIMLWIVLLLLAFTSKNAGDALISNARSIVTDALFKQIPSVSAPTQTETPILISSITVNPLSTPLEPKLDYVLTNVSGKSINAYAVRHVVSHGRQLSEGVVLCTNISTNSLLQSGQWEFGFLGSEAYSERVESIQLIVDFVEFDDGSTWGVDKFKSAERLSGQREGARKEVERLLKLINENNVNVTAQILRGEGSEIEPPADHSPEWSAGFREGINFKRGQLKRIYLKGGSSGVVNELKQPSNIVERKQK